MRTGFARAVRVLARVLERMTPFGGHGGHVGDALALARRQILVAALYIALAALRQRRCGTMTAGQLLGRFSGETWSVEGAGRCKLNGQDI